MLKFVKHHMESILGIEMFPMISLVIFFVFFCLVTFYALGMRKSHVQYMESMPMEEDHELEKDFSQLS